MREQARGDAVRRGRGRLPPRPGGGDPPETARPEATVCLVEKGSEIGARILSGAVIEPRALDDQRDRGPAAVSGREAQRAAADAAAETWLSPLGEMQRPQTHPALRENFERRQAAPLWRAGLVGRRAAVDPPADLPGAALLGDAACFLNGPKIKGTHAAMKSGMLAAEAVAEVLDAASRSRPIG